MRRRPIASPVTPIELEKRWYERWTAYVVGVTALVGAATAFLVGGQQLSEEISRLWSYSGFGSSLYERADQDAIKMLDSFTLPLVASPACSQLAARGQRLRGIVPTIGEIRATENRAGNTSNGTERSLALSALAQVLVVKKDVEAWHESVVKEGCIKRP
jgi:hypothetical protein